MTRMFRLYLVLVIAIVLALASVPFASARPLGTSPSIERTAGGWIGTAVRWLEDVAGLQRSISNRAAAAPTANQKDGGNAATGGSCLDPQGHPKPWCS